MSLPNGFLDELRARVSLTQVVGRKVMWDPRKSNQGKGDMWAPCPFHHEKTASFHVDDRKGFYYCFGCHAKGDALSFIMAQDNVGFMEAVKILADEVGMPMPERDPQAQVKADYRTQLIDVTEQAVQFYRLQLASAAGQGARSYLERRGLGPDAQARWDLGYAPDAWQGLSDHLRAKGVDEALLVDVGLVKTSSKGGKPYDTFRNRIMFPIRDGRGRAIAFGGRAMNPDDPAKYLNSPETQIFDKGRQLYNMKPAREAAGQGKPLIVAEGYMDVIALVEAGFSACVAPLGTAVTEEQLALMWRISPEPIIALDGDNAGQRAALRVVDLALPLLEAGQSLRFCMMPEGQDPDDLLKSAGPQAMTNLLSAAQPMVQLLWRRETEGRNLDSPERKAALDKALRAAISKIKDPSIRSHYGAAIKDLRWELFRSRPNPRQKWQAKPNQAARAKTRRSVLAAPGVAVDIALREAVVLALLLRHPELVRQHDTALSRVDFVDTTHVRIAQSLLRWADMPPDDIREKIATELGPASLEKLVATRHLTVVPAIQRNDAALATICIGEELAKLIARKGVEEEIAEAIQDVQRDDETSTWRLAQATEALSSAERPNRDSETEYEIAPNGVKLDRSERSSLDGLLDQIQHKKDTRRES